MTQKKKQFIIFFFYSVPKISLQKYGCVLSYAKRRIAYEKAEEEGEDEEGKSDGDGNGERKKKKDESEGDSRDDRKEDEENKVSGSDVTAAGEEADDMYDLDGVGLVGVWTQKVWDDMVGADVAWEEYEKKKGGELFVHS
jgi:hypothetical protein